MVIQFCEKHHIKLVNGIKVFGRWIKYCPKCIHESVHELTPEENAETQRHAWGAP